MASVRLTLAVVLVVLLGSLAVEGANLTCPNYLENNGCNTGGCKMNKPGLKGRFEIPSDCPLLVGYGTAEFHLVGEIPDNTDIAVSHKIDVIKRKNATTCCSRCKKKSECTAWQFLDLGSYGGLCFIYKGGKGPKCSEDVLVKTRVGAKCQTEIVADPHLVGAQGTHYDFSGEPGKSFCLISDRALHINMKMTGYLDTRTESATLLKDGKAVRTWIRELGVMWQSGGGLHNLRLVARSGNSTVRGEGFLDMAVVDGEILPRMKVGDKMLFDGGLTIKMEAVEKKGPYDVDFYSVKIDDLLDMDVRLRVANPLLQTPEDAETHIGLGINWMQSTPAIHGVLGQTYREGREQRALDFAKIAAALHHNIAADGENGRGFLDGTPADYRSSGVMNPDCHFSAFAGHELEAIASD